MADAMRYVYIVLGAICLYTGAVVTWPVRRRLYDRYNGNEMVGIACAFYGLVFWILVAVVLVLYLTVI